MMGKWIELVRLVEIQNWWINVNNVENNATHVFISREQARKNRESKQGNRSLIREIRTWSTNSA